MTYENVSRDRNDFRETNLLRDVAFNRHSMNDGHHKSPYDNSTVQIGADGITVKLVQGIDEQSFQRTLSMATRATIGIDLNMPHRWGVSVSGATQCEVCDARLGSSKGQIACPGEETDWEEMLKGGLQTALETAVVVFAVSGVSRTCTHQLVRSRRASFHQQSQRASYYGDHPEVRMPESVWRNSKARVAFEKAFDAAAHAYKTAAECDISYQDARYVLPEGTTNYILCEYSVREFLNVYAYRACSMFSWEIVSVVREMGRLLGMQHPWLKPYIKISCQDRPCDNCGGTGEITDKAEGYPYKATITLSIPCEVCDGTGKVGSRCTFNGWEEVTNQCPFSWAKEENRVFRSEHHRIERKDAGKTD